MLYRVICLSFARHFWYVAGKCRIWHFPVWQIHSVDLDRLSAILRLLILSANRKKPIFLVRKSTLSNATIEWKRTSSSISVETFSTVWTRHDIAQILLMLTLNINQSINQSINQQSGNIRAFTLILLYSRMFRAV